MRVTTRSKNSVNGVADARLGVCAQGVVPGGKGRPEAISPGSGGACQRTRAPVVRNRISSGGSVAWSVWQSV